MAKVAVTACMYLGDLAPYIPIARRLREAGHEVDFVAPSGFAGVLADEPFAHRPYAMDCSPADFDADPVHDKLIRRPTVNAGRLATYWMDRAFADDPVRATASFQAALADADVVVTHPTLAAATIPVARSVGASVVVGHLFPMMIPTSRWTPAVRAWTPDLGRPLNRAAWGTLRAYTAATMRDRAFNTLRDECGLPPLRGNAGWAWTGADETVILTSPHYYGVGASDWPEHTWGGFSLWDGPPGQTLDPDLEAFIHDGPAPVLVTLGSSAAANAGARFARIAADLDAAGLRSVLLVGHERNLAAVAGHPAARTFAPIRQLLPHCSAAVISGALGSLAAVLSAGVPTVAHPQLVDQAWHARRVTQLGVGVAARKSSHVARAVSRLLSDPAFAQRAKTLGSAIADEDAAGAVLDAVNRLAPQP